MTRARAALAAVMLGVAVLLAGCGDDHPGEHCVHSHEEYDPPIYVHSGNVSVPVGGGYRSVCDQWAPDDPATVRKPS